jgi:hypothetical protein
MVTSLPAVVLLFMIPPVTVSALPVILMPPAGSVVLKVMLPIDVRELLFSVSPLVKALPKTKLAPLLGAASQFAVVDQFASPPPPFHVL